MGRPLYSSLLLSRQAPAASEHAAEHNEPASPQVPPVEKWSPWNAFDPDSDEFFQAEDAVYEAFLTAPEIAALQARQAEGARVNGTRIAEVVAEAVGAASASVRGVDGAETGPLRTTGASRGFEDLFLGETRDRIVEEQSRVPGASIPRITLAPPISPMSQTMEGRSPSPDPLDLVSGLPHLSESPQPIQPLDPASRPVSPIPDTPARVSGIFPTTGIGSQPIHVSPPLVAPQQVIRDSRDAYDYYYSLPYRISRLPGDQPSLYRYPPVPFPSPLIS